MFDLYGSHFEFNGVTSRMYGVIVANVSTERNVLLGDSVKINTIFSKKGNRNYYIGDDRSDSPIELDIEFVSDNDKPFEPAKLRKIENWLFNSYGYGKFYMDVTDDCAGETFEYIDGELKRLYLNCRFVNPERIEGNGGVYGLKATMQCDSGMAWQDSATYTYELSKNNSMIEVFVDSDLKDYIYPKVTVAMGSRGGALTINNNTDDANMSAPRFTRFVGVSASASLVMDGETNYINDDNYYKFADKNFVRLLNGVNSISVQGNVQRITFEFSNRRWI